MIGHVTKCQGRYCSLP